VKSTIISVDLQLDGSLSYFNLQICCILNISFTDQCVGRSGTINWHPNAIKFSFPVGIVKNIGCVKKILCRQSQEMVTAAVLACFIVPGPKLNTVWTAMALQIMLTLRLFKVCA
jgi:hypothetical protein